MNSEVSKNPRGKNSLAAVKGGDRSRTILIQVAVAVVLLALIAAIGISIAVKHSNNVKRDAANRPTVTAAATADGLTGSITDKGAIRIAKPGAKATVRVVADMQCPVCKQFEASNGQVLTDEVNSGNIAVEYNVISFLDQNSGGSRYSSRGANAAYCVADADPSKFQAWLSAMYQQQPEEGAGGLPDSKIIQIATAAGITDPSVAKCITDDKYDAYVQKTTQAVFATGINGTPTVFVNDTKVQTQNALFTTDGMKAPIEAALK
ncbi:DsbA family protein [Nocardia macrotermitis]|uniref:DsbA family protein n=1 Tax=Nocardia macrotermitis TaxID=2585198 RepID=UPI0029E7D694|nr:thioredoxin domain-containing protein [Nocardia macrotermitis]